MAVDVERWRGEAKRVLGREDFHYVPDIYAQRIVMLCDEVEDLRGRLSASGKTVLELQDVVSARESDLQKKEAIIVGLERKFDRRVAGDVERLERRIVFLETRIQRMRDREANNAAGMRRLWERLQAATAERDELAARASRGRLRDLDADARAVRGADYVLLFPKHRGETLEHVAVTDPTYVVWLDEQHSTDRPSADVLQLAYDVIAGMKRRERAERARTPEEKIRAGIEAGALRYQEPTTVLGDNAMGPYHGVGCPDETAPHLHGGGRAYTRHRPAERFHRAGRSSLN